MLTRSLVVSFVVCAVTIRFLALSCSDYIIGSEEYPDHF